MSFATQRWFVGLGAALVGVYTWLAITDDLTHRIPLFLFIVALAFVIYAVAVARVLRSRPVSIPVVVAVAIVSRLVLIPSAPDLSTDIYRYIWEGRMTWEGVNPFAVAPDDPRLTHLRDHNFESINHKDLATIYPPLAQGVFALAAKPRPGVTAMKLWLTLFEVGTIFLLLQWLPLLGRPPEYSLLYAWNPIAIVETARAGHVDAIGVFFVVLAALLWTRQRNQAGFAALAFSVLSKYFSLALVPFFALRTRYWKAVMLLPLLVVAAYLPFASAGEGLFASLQLYSRDWQFNGLPYRLMQLAGLPGDWIRLVLVGALAVLVLWWARRDDEIVDYAFHIFGATLLLVPTLYPWYVLWMVPWLCVRPNPAWILFTGLVFITYVVWIDYNAAGTWFLQPWVYVVEYLPFYALLGWQLVRRHRRTA